MFNLLRLFYFILLYTFNPVEFHELEFSLPELWFYFKTIAMLVSDFFTLRSFDDIVGGSNFSANLKIKPKL